jgi:hypothetical protein
MDTSGFHIPEGSMDEAALYSSDVPWEAFKAFIQ